MDTYLGSFVFFIGTVVNLLLVTLAAWGLWAFYPRRATRGFSAPSWLILAIWLGFLAWGMNVLYWHLIGDILLKLRITTLETLYVVGHLYIDHIWKAVACASIYLHFFARWKAIPSDEQHVWSPLLMGFYPDLTHWAVRMGVKMQALWRKPNKD